jgi:hypothetical protein
MQIYEILPITAFTVITYCLVALIVLMTKLIGRKTKAKVSK